MPRTQRRWWLALASIGALLAAAGCRATDPSADLELLPRAAERDPGAPPNHVVLARSDLGPGGGPVELWLPLPRSDEFQTVKSLVIEVGPPGTYEVEDQPGGERLLHVRSPAPTPISVRAVIEPSLVELPPAALPPDLAALPTGEPAAWVAAATARGATARLMTGLEVAAHELVPRRWAEVLIEGGWAGVGAPPDHVRLGSTPARATVDGRPAEVRTTYALQTTP